MGRGRPPKKVNIDNAPDVFRYLTELQDNYFKFGEDKYSKVYLDALKNRTFSDLAFKEINQDFLIYDGESEKIEKMVPIIQSFLDSNMENSDRLMMWQAIRRKEKTRSSLYGSFQITLDGMESSRFNSLKDDVISNVGIDGDDKLSNTDIIVGLINFAAKIEDPSIKDMITKNIYHHRSERQQLAYELSDIFKKRKDACIQALIDLGLDEKEADSFIYSVELPAFDNKKIYQLLNDKEDKPVPRYLAKLHKLRKPNDNLRNNPESPQYHELASWVVLPTDDIQE